MRVHADIILYLTTLQWYTIYTAVITITYIRAVVCGTDVDPLSNEVCELLLFYEPIRIHVFLPFL